jgi:hypothetical protein
MILFLIFLIIVSLLNVSNTLDILPIAFFSFFYVLFVTSVGLFNETLVLLLVPSFDIIMHFLYPLHMLLVYILHSPMLVVSLIVAKPAP